MRFLFFLVVLVNFFALSSSALANVALFDMAGSSESDVRHMFSSFRHSGRYWIIVMYASWCQHCSQDLPGVVRFSNKFSDIGIDLISFDTNLDALRKFLERKNFSNSTRTYVFSKVRDIGTFVGAARKILKLNFSGTIPFYAVIESDTDKIVLQSNSFSMINDFFVNLSSR